MDVGTSVKVNITVTDENGDVTDPSSLSLITISPAHTYATYTYDADIARAGTGLYSMTLTPDESGVWLYQWTSAGPQVVQEGSFTIEQTFTAEIARTSMADLILELRSLTNAQRDAYTLDGVTWWTDAQLQNVLDHVSEDVKRLELDIRPDVVGGSYYYYDYYIPEGYGHRWERSGSESKWAVCNDLGGTISTGDYSVNWYSGRITFTADTGGSARYLTATRFNMNEAAARIWSQKAAHISEVSYDITLDGHKLSRSQRLNMYMQMADSYKARSGFDVIPLVRSDIVGV